jgi:hypothetical protein
VYNFNYTQTALGGRKLKRNYVWGGGTRTKTKGLNTADLDDVCQLSDKSTSIGYVMMGAGGSSKTLVTI